MHRCLAFLLALLFTTMTVASACSASDFDRVNFTLQPSRGGGAIQASFRSDRREDGDNHWSSSFAPGDLAGLDVAGFRGAGARPLRFAVVREAGRLDCSGNGGESFAAGYCSFSVDPGFSRLLDSRGIGRPTREQAFGLVALDVRRGLIDAVAAARYPAPTIDQLLAMTAVGVDAGYIRDLARLGYRPRSLQSLVEFRALNITPAYIGGFQRIGYRDLEPDTLVQFKALGVTPDYVASFQSLGYRDLPADKLVEMKALGITPEFVRSVGLRPAAVLPVSELVRRKILDERR